jgi:transcription elongation factor Elf1
MFRCFYCDRTTANENAVAVRLTTGVLSCADCTAHDTKA